MRHVLKKTVVVPQTVTMRQAKLALAWSALLDDADAAIAAMTGLEGQLARIEWNTGATLRRDHPLCLSIGAQLGLPDDVIDNLFQFANTL